MVVIADGNVGAGADVVVGVEVEEAGGARVSVALEVAADPIVAIADASGEEFAFGVQKKAGGLDGGSGDDDEIGGLL